MHSEEGGGREGGARDGGQIEPFLTSLDCTGLEKLSSHLHMHEVRLNFPTGALLAVANNKQP